MSNVVVSQFLSVLMVFPVVLGRGKRLFAGGANTTVLRLVDHRQVGSDGVLILTYQPRAA